MLQTIFHQIWSQRRQNAWIFLELLLVSFFLFTVIDPLYVLYSNRLIPSGYDTGRCYQVQIKPYHAKHPKFNPEMNADSLADLNYRRIGEVIARLPEVESYALVGSASIPNGNSWSGSQLYADTADVKQGKNDAARQGGVSVQIYNMVATSGCDMFRTYGIRDVRTDDILSFDANERDVKYISSYCARLLFGLPTWWRAHGLQ